jgi:hypothetical protein
MRHQVTKPEDIARHAVDTEERRLAASGMQFDQRRPGSVADLLVQQRRQVLDRRLLEKRGERQMHAKRIMNLRKHAHRQHGITAQGKKVVGDADACPP